MRTNISSSEQGAHDQLSALLAAVHRSWFRLETLQAYAAPADDPDFTAFMAGDRRPVRPGAWESMVAEHVRHGRNLSRVHIVREPWSDYVRWELHAYAANQAAGERVFILPVRVDAPWPTTLPEGDDFWILDDDVWCMQYSPDGQWLSCQLVTGPRAAVYHHRRSVSMVDAVALENYLSEPHPRPVI